MEKEKLWEDKYVKSVHTEKTLHETAYYYNDAWGAVLYVKNSFGKIQRIYADENEYLRAIGRI